MSPTTTTGTGTGNHDVYSVTRLNREARAVLEGSFPVLWVQGELSNLARPGSGHLYFSLKDAHSQVRCAMFRNRHRGLRIVPDNGAQVLVRATVSLYEGRGEFQLIVEEMEEAGAGALQQAFEALKQKLLQEGLFNEARKRPLPPFPGTIGVVTSPTGAAIRDILTVLKRRFSAAAVVIYPTQVQGSDAPAQIVAALRAAAARHECDVLIIARGGGSLEDLWAFNDEAVARAIAASPMPVVTGIGHEVDFTIADFVADRRAPTPSAAAELATPDRRELLDWLALRERKLFHGLAQSMRQRRQTLYQLGRRLPPPARRLQSLIQRLDELGGRLQQSTRRLLADKRGTLLQQHTRLDRHHPARVVHLQGDRALWLYGRLLRGTRHHLQLISGRIERLSGTIQALGPQSTLERGYAIVTDASGRVVRQAGTLSAGAMVDARFARGRARARIEGVTDDDPQTG